VKPAGTVRMKRGAHPTPPESAAPDPKLVEDLKAMTLQDWVGMRREYAIKVAALDALIARKMANDPWIALAKNGDGDRLLDAREAAEKLGLKVPTVAEMLRRGQLPKVMVGRYVRVRKSDLDKFIAKGGR